MRKTLLLALIGLSGLVSAQQEKNEKLAKRLENERQATETELDFYLAKMNHLLSDESPENKTQIEAKRQYILDNRNNIAFFFEGKPFFLKATDTDQISNANADHIQEGKIEGLNGSFNGEGIHITVIDGGRVYASHTDLQSPNGTPRVTNKEDSNVPYSSHATGVTGMIGGTGHTIGYISNGVRYSGNTKGMTPLATFDSYSFSTTTLPGENSPKNALQKLLHSLANISNHSYGIDAGWALTRHNGDLAWEYIGWFFSPNYYFDFNGVYHDIDQYLDNIVYNNPSMIVLKAAGNSFGDGPNGSHLTTAIYRGNLFNPADTLPPNNCAQGYDCIPSGTVAKNIIVVGSTKKIETNDKRYTQTSDVIKASYSSAGPRDDGAIKPDIAGVGSDIWYPSTSPTGSNSWAKNSGTSFSTPKVTGMIGLWTEINRSLFNQDLHAASAKTLLIHSAAEAGENPGPDVWYGWGFANAKKGAELLVDKSNNKIIFEDKTLENNAVNELLLESDGSQPLKVTISWVDPQYTVMARTLGQLHNNRTSNLVNDLDLRITNINTGEVYYPWKLDINNPMAAATKGDNTVDNVEQVIIDSPTVGLYKVEVSHKGNLVNNDDTPAVAPQNYTIIASGYKKALSEAGISAVVSPSLLVGNDKTTTIQSSQKLSNVSVYDMSGRLLKSEKASGFTHDLDFGNHVKGVYIVHIKLVNASEPIVRKVVKR